MKPEIEINKSNLNEKVIYSIVVPLYNEELVIEESYSRLKKVLDSTNENYELIFVNDGSRDLTEERVIGIKKSDPKVRLINFSRNFGHQAAITAGMEKSKGDAVVVIDADLQDPPEVILQMIEKWKMGFDVVYGKRLKRKGETIFKKVTASMFYRFLRSMTSIDIPADTGDFRLIDRKVCNALISLPERNRFVRGLVCWVGYKQTSVEFVRQERFAGETKYPLKKMMKLALDGITAFSYVPLKIPGIIGMFTLGIGFIAFLVSIISSIIYGISIINIGFLTALSLVFFGIILCSIGVMGEYIGRIFDESKRRPVYIANNEMNMKEAVLDGRAKQNI